MSKKILIAALATVTVLLACGFIWARSVLTGENVRAALAAQIAQAIGQPVTIGDVTAGILPRVTVKLGDVSIGGPDRLAIEQLEIGTDFRALLSRRIEHAHVRLKGAHVRLPLPAFTIGASTGASGSSPVELVSIDEVVLNDVQVVSGDRTLTGEIELVPQGQGVIVRKLALSADDTSVNVTGQITDLAGPVGELTMKAGGINLDRLLAFASDFAAESGAAATGPSTSSPPSRAASAHGMRVTIALEAEDARIGGLTLNKLTGKALATDDGLALDPVTFGVFGGSYQGSLALAPAGDTLRFRGTSTLANVDVATATAFAGSPNTITGRLSGRLDFAGTGTDLSAVMKTVQGKGRIDVVDGVIRNLGLINTIVVATSMRSDSIDPTASSATSASNDEPFSRLGASLVMGNGALGVSDMRLESKDVLMDAQGVIGLLTQAVNLKGRVQLSDALSQQAGRDLIRYTQEQGRVTLPVSVTGTVQTPRVQIDVGSAAKRALQNAAMEKLNKALGKSLEGLFGR